MQNINTPTPYDLNTERLPMGFQLVEDSAPPAKAVEQVSVLSQFPELTIPYSSSAIVRLALLEEELRYSATEMYTKALRQGDPSDSVVSNVIALLEKVRSLKEYRDTLRTGTSYGNRISLGAS
jgi:hypothetical protein